MSKASHLPTTGNSLLLQWAICHPITKGATRPSAAEILGWNLQQHGQNEEQEP